MDNHKNKKKVLFIAYYYHQREMVASNRTHAIFDYLNQFGWDVTLLTVPPKNHPVLSLPNIIHAKHPLGFLKIYFKFSKQDSWGLVDNKQTKNEYESHLLPRFIKKIFSSLGRVKWLSRIAVKIYSLCSLIYFPDLSSGWYKPALKAARRELQQNKYDAILSTSGPFTAHKIAEKLHSEFKLPWIADYRDPWSQRKFTSFPVSSTRLFLEERYERKLLNSASMITAVSPNLATELSSYHLKKSAVIMNGFDPKNIIHDVPLRNKFTITYTGALYTKETRDPTLLFTAVSELISSGIIPHGDILIEFYGPAADWMDKEIQRYKLDNVVVQCGMVSKDTALQLQRTAQILLVLLWSGESSEGVIAGKIFEYFSASRPILATGQNDTISNIFEVTGVGKCISSLDCLKLQLQEWYCEYQKNGFVQYLGNETEVDKYSYREMANNFADVLNEIVLC